MGERRPAFLLLVAAVVLLAPSLIFGNLISHSSPQNLTWAEQFAAQFRGGIPYPRVLPGSFDGLTAPTFYFYPPLAFWVDALVSVATFNVIPTSYRLSLSSLLLLWASGMAMRFWLKGEATSPRAALWGALAYMAAPYHLLDHYYRGAYAEFAAFAVLPLVALGVRRIANGERWGPAVLALSYAALPMAHLPTALLVSATMLPAYVLYRGWRFGDTARAARFFIRCAVSGILGLGIAAVYLLPALTLQDWISPEVLWARDYVVDKWFLLTPDRWPRPIDMMLIIAACAVAYALAAVGVMVAATRVGELAGARMEATFWATLSLVCLILVAGAVPWFWQLPFVAKVQFPWRLMSVVEFATVTALCCVSWPLRSRVANYLVVAAIVVLVPGVGEMTAGIGLRIDVSRSQADVPADVKEFLPAGYPLKPGGSYAELNLEPVRDLPPAACTPTPRICRASSEGFDRLRIELDADAPTTVVLRRFYYPMWRLDPELPLVVTEPLRLVSFRAPSGRKVYSLERVAVREERVGWAISALALVLLLVWSGVEWGIRRP